MRMRIAQIAPPFESVPPSGYGGTERVVSVLTEELVRRGHEVTLFASGDACTAARLVAVAERALRLDPAVPDPYPHTLRPAGAGAGRDDAARPARPARLAGDLQCLPRGGARLDQRRAARPAAPGQLARHGLQRHRPGALPLPSRA